MSWIGTVPYLLVCGNTPTVTVGNNQLTTTDFMGFMDGTIPSLLHLTTGYGTQGGGPTPVGIWHNWEVTTGNPPTKAAQTVYPALARPFMGVFNSESSSATPQSELDTLSAVCSTAMANMVANASNQDKSRLFMWAPSLSVYNQNVQSCAPNANWILLQGQNPLSSGGPPQFFQVMQPPIQLARNANPAVRVMVQVSVTQGVSNDTIVAALHTLDADQPDGISIFAGGTPDNSVQAGQLITLLRSS
jgi:hypothetical protein